MIARGCDDLRPIDYGNLGVIGGRNEAREVGELAGM
jgi:hypothetical protein